jgi:hypothetical protein
MSKLTGTEAVIALVLGFLFGIAIIVGFSALSALIIAWAWNAFMPSVFGLPSITFWQAFALTILLSSIRQVVHVTRKKD